MAESELGDDLLDRYLDLWDYKTDIRSAMVAMSRNAINSDRAAAMSREDMATTNKAAPKKIDVD